MQKLSVATAQRTLPSLCLLESTAFVSSSQTLTSRARRHSPLRQPAGTATPVASRRPQPSRLLTTLPLLPKLWRPQRSFLFVANPKDLDPEEVRLCYFCYNPLSHGQSLAWLAACWHPPASKTPRAKRADGPHLHLLIHIDGICNTDHMF